ncbi:ABC transporter ATP-binding protein [Methylophilaceae bacterium]|nr:ABC transporter ATP-binding protein [Methylophilaceae bacterium]
MTSITAKNLSLSFDINISKNASLKKLILNKAVGGAIIQSNSKTEIQALNNICFQIKIGDRIGILGHNGSGKTTLLRAIAGIYHPTSGTLDVAGTVTSLLEISMGIDTEATGLESIRMRGVMMGLTLQRIKSLEDEVIEFSELGNYIDMPIRTYSTGMNMRLAFAIATATRPEILLLDEWLSVSDKDFQHKAEIRMQDFIKKTKILVLASHSPELLKKTCNRFFRLSKGVLEEISSNDI